LLPLNLCHLMSQGVVATVKLTQPQVVAVAALAAPPRVLQAETIHRRLHHR